MKRTLINIMGISGVISLMSYAAAVIFSPMAYPGYNWISQAVSDLSADNAPSKMLWQQLSCLYDICGLVSVMMVCVYVQGRLNKALRTGIYLFAAMNWISAAGYAMFPLSDSGSGESFRDIMHIYVVTLPVVVLSVTSLIFIMAGGFRDKKYRSLGAWAGASLLLMLAGAAGTAIVPREFFGIPERFSVFAAAGFNAVLGIYLFNGFYEDTGDKYDIKA